MPISIRVNGVQRHFDFYAPVGWERWVEKLQTGLPVVIAFHGGGQDPAGFQDKWFFPALADGQTADANRFFTFYPHGAPQYFSNEPSVAQLGWRTGYSPLGYLGNDYDDVAFVQQMLFTMANRLEDRLQDVQISLAPFDDDRIHLFGYSMGGMLCHRLADEDPNRYASMWVQSASSGGQAHDGGPNDDYGAPIEWKPNSTHALSYFHHHGGMDTNVDPYGSATDPPNRSTVSTATFQAVGGLSASIAQRYARTDYPAERTLVEYGQFNAAGNKTVSTGEADRNGGFTSTLTSYTRGGSSNPIAQYYLDPTMTHTNFTEVGSNRYFEASDVWNWFKDHPRVL